MIESVSKVELKNVLKDIFQGPLENRPSIQAFFLSTLDGRTVAKFTRKDFSDSRISAMCSSTIGLADKIAQEVEHDECEFAILQNKDGFMVMKKLKSNLVLILATSKEENLGIVLSHVKNFSNQLNEVL